jgi:hypothetical protein
LSYLLPPASLLPASLLTYLPTYLLTTLAPGDQNPLWIGLYRAGTDGDDGGDDDGSGAGGGNASRSGAAAGAAGGRWQWAGGAPTEAAAKEGSASPPLPSGWRHGQPDSHFGREDCAYVSMTTGEWDDFGCDLRELRCLCELGGAATEAYHATMRAHAAEMEEETARQRVWAALVVGAFFAFPFLGSANGGGTQQLCRSSVLQLAAPHLGVHLGVGLCLCGSAP